MKNYKHSVSTMEVLLWESELTPKPEEHLITITPNEDDLAFVSDTEKEYVFKNGNWVESQASTDPKEGKDSHMILR